MAQGIKLLYAMPYWSTHIGATVQILATMLPIYLPANVPWKGAEVQPCPWIPATHVKFLVELLAPGFGLILFQPLTPPGE